MPRLPEADGERAGAVGRGPLLRLLILGDSSAVGVGVARQQDALSGHLSRALARQCGARVRWQLLARSGVTSAQCLQMLEADFAGVADIAVVVLGVNDVVDQVPSARAVAAREAIANRLRNAHGVAHVVFAPLPPVHRFPGLPQPLRWVAGADARRHDAAVARWAAGRADVSHVPIVVPLGRGVMADDGFHPGEPVYRVCGLALAEHIATAVWPRLDRRAS
jgi:lysophospholipase L1-like esterase